MLTGTITSLGAVVVAKSFGLLESIAVARIIGDVQFGLLALVLSVTNLVLACGVLGLPSALTKFLSGEVSGSREATWGTIRRAVRLVTIAASLVGFLAGFLVVQSLLPSALGSYKYLFVIGTVLVAASAPLVLFGNALQGLGHIPELNLRAGLAAVVGLGLAIPLSLYFGIMGALIAFIASATLVGFLALPLVWKLVRNIPSSDKTKAVSVRTLLNYGIPILISGLIVLVAFYWVNSLLALGPGFGDLGSFTVAFTLANVITLLSSSIGVPLVPLLSSLSLNDPEKGRMVVARVMRITIFITVPFLIVAICFSREILAITYGSRFAKGASYLPILALSSFLASISGIVGNQIAGTGKMWWGLGINVIWTSTIFLASTLLIPIYEGVGASFSILAAYSVLALVALVVQKSVLHVRIPGLAKPAAWAATLIASSFLVWLFGADWRIPFGVFLLGGSLVSMKLLLSPSERAVVTDILSSVQTRLRSGRRT